MKARTPAHDRQRGAATLLVTVMLALAMVLAVACASRNLAAEQRASASQWQSARAFEAAEAGIEWIAARLNDGQPIGDDCLPSTDAAALSFRASHLRSAAPSGGWTTATWNDSGTAAPFQAACMRDDAGWHCSCPTGGPATPARAGDGAATRFQVELAPGTRPDVIHAVVAGCTQADSICSSTASGDHDAAARIEADFAFVPALRSMPAATVTARGAMHTSAALTVENADAATGGLVVQAGGSIDAASLGIVAPLGSPTAGTLAVGDAVLAGLDRDRFFARYFGMAPADWSAQPAVATLACASACAAALVQAVDRGSRLIAVDGDASLVGPLALGSADAPIVLVVRGRLEIDGAVAVHGVVYADALDWSHAAAPAAFVRGAVVVGGDYTGDAAPALVRDATLLRKLGQASGTFVRINGSWKDF